MSNFPLRKIELLAPLSERERRALEGVLARHVVFGAREDIVCEGDRPDHSTVVLEGMTCRYKTLSAGQRQIMNFGVPGDWVDLHSYFLPIMDHSLCAMSPCLVAQIPHAAVRKLIEDHPPGPATPMPASPTCFASFTSGWSR
jgi:CRP-like cAMP-binding protein